MSTQQDERVRSLRDLPQSIAPPDALWGRIAAQISPPAQAPPARRVPVLAAAAAILCALIVGALLGRAMLPAPQQTAATRPPAASSGALEAMPVTFIQDPRYQQQRTALLADLQTQLAALPPQTRHEVLASLATIHQSMQELQTALGRDPANALLQELLVDTCQDEMRVLVSVHEAGAAGQGI